MNADIPVHFYAMVRREFLMDHEGAGEFEDAAVFAIRSVPGRALGFRVHLRSGAQFEGLPIHALCWRKDAPVRSLEVLETWDAFGYDVEAHAYAYLRERAATVYLADGEHADGVYLFSVDWRDNGYSDAPDQRKDLHVVRLDEGNFCAVPNNRVIWHDLSFVRFRGLPELRTNTHVYYAEERVVKIDRNVQGGDA